jgi:hypothetical protein
MTLSPQWRLPLGRSFDIAKRGQSKEETEGLSLAAKLAIAVAEKINERRKNADIATNKEEPPKSDS